ncbi:MAG TPA: hypothetical protein DCR71_04400, partial [Dehalococcoidia bacterium]|nr:hypothetical protein [Dehalococcoidia bacterium]
MINTKVENCNNITLANIQLKENYLNIRYAMNGTGKSTIAKAMHICANGKDFSELVPFDGEVTPSCSISPELSNIFVFNEDYVDRVVLQDDEAIQDAFEVFIKTPEYERQME